MGALSASLARRRQFTLQMGLGDIFKKALANDPSLPPATNPGLSGKEDKAVEVEFLPAKKTVKAYPGQKLSLLATAAKVNINYQCQKGECGTCTVKFNGTPVKTCQASLPINSSTKKYTIVVPKEPPKRRR